MQENRTSTFASDLGLRPGQWPKQIKHSDAIWFRGKSVINGDDELMYYEYEIYPYPWERKVLVVFND